MKTKRWQSYHRALKRGEAWAVKISKLPLMCQLLYRFYAGESTLMGLVFAENPLFKLLSKTDSWTGGDHVVPFPSFIVGPKRKRSAHRNKKTID